jgi:hypothetical protein
MPTRRFHYAALIAAAAIVSTSAARADEPVTTVETHIRALSPALRSLVDESIERSPSFRSLVEQIDASNLIVYLNYYLFRTQNIDGRLTLLGAAGGRRYVMIQIASLRTRVDQFGILGHELRHATEVAAAPFIVDSPSLARHYATIGFLARQWQQGMAFETTSAVDVGSRVQHEVIDSIRAEEAETRAARETARGDRALKVRDGS